MNLLEFVSAQYASINIDHSFNGFILNKIPVIKKLKLKEIVTCKVLYGSLRNENYPDTQKNAFIFPSDDTGTPLTYTLANSSYIEAGFGFSNILRIFRVDFIRRLSYLGSPNIDKTGFRVQFRLDI